MPANLTPDYEKAEQKFREARSDELDPAAPDPTYAQLLTGTEVDLPPEPASVQKSAALQ